MATRSVNLFDLPDEILLCILEKIRYSQFRFLLTVCRRMNALVIPLLYRTIKITSMERGEKLASTLVAQPARACLIKDAKFVYNPISKKSGLELLMRLPAVHTGVLHSSRDSPNETVVQNVLSLASKNLCLTVLRTLTITEPKDQSMPKFTSPPSILLIALPNLRIVHFQYVFLWTGAPMVIPAIALEKLPPLETLKLTRCHFTTRGFQQLISLRPILGLEFSEYETPPVLGRIERYTKMSRWISIIHESVPKLEHLAISIAALCAYEPLALSRFTSLKHLEIRGLELFNQLMQPKDTHTHADIEKLLQHEMPPHLESLTLTDPLVTTSKISHLPIICKILSMLVGKKAKLAPKLCKISFPLLDPAYCQKYLHTQPDLIDAAEELLYMCKVSGVELVRYHEERLAKGDKEKVKSMQADEHNNGRRSLLGHLRHVNTSTTEREPEEDRERRSRKSRALGAVQKRTKSRNARRQRVRKGGWEIEEAVSKALRGGDGA